MINKSKIKFKSKRNKFGLLSKRSSYLTSNTFRKHIGNKATTTAKLKVEGTL
jgi:hypothetical protein